MSKAYEGPGAEGQLRLYHIPQVPMEGMIVDVSSPAEAVRIARILWNYDIFQFENNVKPDYSNMTGLIVHEGGEWTDWYSPGGESFDEYEREFDTPKPKPQPVTVFEHLVSALEHDKDGMTPDTIRTVLIDRWPSYFGEEAEVIFATLSVDMATADAGEKMYQAQELAAQNERDGTY